MEKKKIYDTSATNKVNHYEIKEEDDLQYTQYITWPGQVADDNPRPIL